MTDGDVSTQGTAEPTTGERLDLPGLEEGRRRSRSVVRWFLVTGNRRLVTLVLLATVFAVLVVGGNVWPLRMRGLLEETNTVQMLFNTLLSGIILLVSIVVSINSVAVSQELGSLGTHFERVQESLTFRESLEEVSDEPISPSQADRFLGFVLETVYSRLRVVDETFEDHPNDDVRSRVQKLVDVADEDLRSVAERFNAVNLERPNVLLAGLEFDYATHLHTLRFLRTYYGDELDDDQQQALDELTEALHFFAASREYFKTLFYQRELSDLSSTLLYVSLPTIVYTAYVILAVDAGLFPDLSLLGLPLLLLYITLAFTIALAPYLVLTSYVVRTAFVSRRSLEVGPFMAQPNVSKPELTWEE